MERRGYVELGRRMRHLCHLQSSGYGRLSAMSGGEQEGGLRPTGLRGRLGRVQPLVPLLLHVALGQTEQSLPTVPAGVVYPTNGKVILTAGSSRPRLSYRRRRRENCEFSPSIFGFENHRWNLVNKSLDVIFYTNGILFDSNIHT